MRESNRLKKIKSDIHKSTCEGYTIVEVMLALGISALMLIGILGGTYSSISQQRYTDSLRDFAEYIRSIYSEVISPQSLGLGNSSKNAILGKVLVFGEGDDNSSTVYSATIIGKADIPVSMNLGFIGELSNSDYKVRLFCGDNTKSPGDLGYNSTVGSYTTLWQTQLRELGNPQTSQKFKGTLIISRSLTSATVHTAFLKDITYNLAEQCLPDNQTASTQFSNDLRTYTAQYTDSLSQDTGICVNPDGGAAVPREVRIAADGRNTSAVRIMEDNEDNKCR